MKLEKLSQLDTNCFKSFLVSSETLNFTHAASQIGLTQSGISQHISRLEEQLGTPLFVRVGKKLHITPAGAELKKFIESYSESVSSLLDKINDHESLPQGKVSYSMPESCLLSPHFNMLLQARRKNFPGIDLTVQLNSSEKVVELLLANEIDFGFVTKKIVMPEIEAFPFCKEEYVLATGLSVKNLTTVKELEDLPWISYPGSDILFECWSAHHFPKNKNLNFRSLNKSGHFNSIHPPLSMIEHGDAVTIIPYHCIEKLHQEKKIRVHFREGKSFCTNTIYIITLNGVKRPRRVDTVIDFFRSIKS